MNKFAVYFTDLHCNLYTQFTEHHDRLGDCIKVLDDVFKLASANNASTILFGGDLGDLPKVVFIQVIDSLMIAFAKWFKKLPNVTFYAISGNHDQSKKNYWDKPAKTLLSVFATAFPGRFVLIDNKLAEIGDNCFVAGIPYYENKVCFDKALDEMHECCLFPNQPEVKVTLLIHQTPEGIYNKHIKADTNPADSRYAVFNLVLCGHIHQHQKITNKFIIGGNPLHRDLGDIGQDKGIWLLDLADPAASIEFISRKGRYPEFVRAKPESVTEELQASSFVVVTQEHRDIVVEGSADIRQFSAAHSPADLLKNYWEATEGTDERLLKVGLSLIQ